MASFWIGLLRFVWSDALWRVRRFSARKGWKSAKKKNFNQVRAQCAAILLLPLKEKFMCFLLVTSGKQLPHKIFWDIHIIYPVHLLPTVLLCLDSSYNKRVEQISVHLPSAVPSYSNIVTSPIAKVLSFCHLHPTKVAKSCWWELRNSCYRHVRPEKTCVIHGWIGFLVLLTWLVHAKNLLGLNIFVWSSCILEVVKCYI